MSAAAPHLALPLPGGLAMQFMRIPAGDFRMGSRGMDPDEEPRHRVVISQDFYLGQHVVTQEEWRALAEVDPALRERSAPSHFKGERRPVEEVSWDDATAWLAAWTRWLGGRPGGLPPELRSGWELRLPTEAEWEYACRGGTETEYYDGDGEAALVDVGWYDENSGRQTHSVDEKPERHPLGLCGMHGNVWEWCRDVWRGANYRRRIAGDVADEEALWEGETHDDLPRVIRGGSWVNTPRWCRAANRVGGRPVNCSWYLGFRVCLAPGPAFAEASARQGGGRQPGNEAGQGAEGGGRGTSPEPPAPGTAEVDPGSMDLARARLPRRRRNPGGTK